MRPTERSTRNYNIPPVFDEAFSDYGALLGLSIFFAFYFGVAYKIMNFIQCLKKTEKG